MNKKKNNRIVTDYMNFKDYGTKQNKQNSLELPTPPLENKKRT